MHIFGFILYFFVIPLIVFVVSRWLDRQYKKSGNRRVLIMACAWFSLSYFIPSPSIHGEQTQFMTHVIGGGVFCGLLWLYHRSKFTFVPTVWYWELASLFALTSALGVLNELYELVAFEFLGTAPVTDTSYDLLANTLGMLAFFALYRLSLYRRV